MNLETTLPQALWEAVRTNYEKRNYSGAVLDAFYCLSDLLRAKSGALSDGAALIGEALGGHDPKIKINRLKSESEKSVQRGLEMTLRGIYQAIRNPRSHQKVTDTEDDARALILFIGYLTRQLDQAKAQFEIAEFMKKVFDSDFVPQERYAQLLVAEIPSSQRLEVFLEVFQQLQTGRPEALARFFKALMQVMSDDEMHAVYDTVSEALRTAEEDNAIRQLITSFDGDLWPNLSEVARLRIEHRLIGSVREGLYNSQQRRARSGSLGAWSTTLFPHFALKGEMLDVIIDKLRSSSEESQDYVFAFLFSSLDKLSDQMPDSICASIVQNLRRGDSRFHSAVTRRCPWSVESFPTVLRKAIQDFRPNDFPAEEDLPF